MNILRSRKAVALASAAALAMTATPVLAQGWGGGWGGGHRRHHNDDTGWIVGGLIGLITIGAIAASASNKNKRDRDRDGRYPDRDYRDDGYRDGGYRGGGYRGDDSRYGNRSDSGYRDQGYRSSSSSRGIDGAVDNCASEVERGSTRIESVDSVAREGEGWRIEGRVSGGKPFTCTADRSGRISGVSVDGRAPY